MTNAISGTGSLEKLGAANQILVGNSTYSGGTLINGGTLTVGTNGTDGTIGSGDITNNAIFQVRRSDAYTLNQTISGTGQFRQDGDGTTTLTGDNTFSAATLVNSGALELNTTGGSALGGTASVSVASGATLLISKSDQVNNSATITLSGGTISRGAGVSEVMGNLDLTAASTINYGAGATGTLTFGTYTPSSLLTVSSFLEGNKLVFGTDLTTSVTNSSYFSFDNGFTSSWDGSTFTITAIPEPSTYAAAVGLLALMLWSLRRRTKRA